MTLPPFPFVPASPEERLRLTQYGELVRAMEREAERIVWSVLEREGATVGPAFIRDGSGRFNGYCVISKKADVATGATMLEAAQNFVAAVDATAKEGLE